MCAVADEQLVDIFNLKTAKGSVVSANFCGNEEQWCYATQFSFLKVDFQVDDLN